MIFDTAAGMLDPYNFSRYVTEPISEFAKMFPKQIGYYAKNSTEEQAKQIHEINNLAGFGVDHRFSIQETLKTFGGKGFIQGNFDQELLFADPTTLKQKLESIFYPSKI